MNSEKEGHVYSNRLLNIETFWIFMELHVFFLFYLQKKVYFTCVMGMYKN